MAKTCRITCSIFMGVTVILQGIGLLFAWLASGSPISHIVLFRTALFWLMALGLLLAFKWPWYAVAASWIDLLLIVCGVFPAEERSVTWF
jgi:hypothetical protein